MANEFGDINIGEKINLALEYNNRRLFPYYINENKNRQKRLNYKLTKIKKILKFLKMLLTLFKKFNCVLIYIFVIKLSFCFF